ncbi:MAG TPA: zf-HC2 domain-containing protein [Actinomycetes bacterium]
MPDHPDREQLAAWQAGDLGDAQRGRLAAHLAGCAACAATVADLEAVSARLAVLAEPELPAGFHQRLMTAVERELPTEAPRRRAAAARRAWFPRASTLAAAAALLLFAVGVLGLIRLNSHGGAAGGAASSSDSGGGGGKAAVRPNAAAAGSGALPVIRLQGEFSPARLQEAVDHSPVALQALRATPPRAATGAASTTQRAGPTMGVESDSGQRLKGSDPRACIDQALGQAGASGLRPAFFVETKYQGQPALLLVASVPGGRGQLRYFVFPAGNCAAVPADQGQATVSVR